MDLTYMLDMTSYSLHRHMAATILNELEWQDLGSLSFKKNGKITLSGDYWEITYPDNSFYYFIYREFLNRIRRIDPDFELDPRFSVFEDFLDISKNKIQQLVAGRKLIDLGWAKDDLYNRFTRDEQRVFLHEDGFWLKNHPHDWGLFYPYNMFKTIIF